MPDRPSRRRAPRAARPASEAAPLSAPCPVTLPAALDLRAAAPLAASLAELRGRDVTLDAGGVRRLGAQCLAVLLAAQAAWAREGARFVIAAASPEFTEGVALLGAAPLLPLPTA